MYPANIRGKPQIKLTTYCLNESSKEVLRGNPRAKLVQKCE